MKRKYTRPIIEKEFIDIEGTIAVGSSVSFGGATNSFPDVEDATVEENIFDIEF